MRNKMPKSIHRTPTLYSIIFAFSQEFYMYVQRLQEDMPAQQQSGLLPII